MSKYFMAVFIIMAALNVFSQSNNPTYNYSVGISGYSYRQMPKMLDQANNKSYLGSVFNYFTVKFNDNLLSYRLNGGYLNQAFTFNNVCNSCDIVAGRISDFTAKLGVEKSLNYSVIQPYAGIDVGYKSSRYAGISRNNNILKQNLADANGTTLPQSSVGLTKEGFIISPVFGIKASPVKQLSVFIEASLDFFYSAEKQELVTQDAFNHQISNKYYKSEFLLNPISIGLQFNFGEK